jgi:hypothetical protein
MQHGRSQRAARYSAQQRDQVVPATAIARIGAQNYVYAVKDGKAARLPVQLGVSGVGEGGVQDVTLISGGPSGTQVVSGDVNALWDGAPLQVR